MRRDVPRVIIALAALLAAAVYSESYARLMSPAYLVVARFLADNQPWDITAVEVEPGKADIHGELHLRADIRRHLGDSKPVARVVGHLQVGSVVETPLIFWAILLLWPSGSGERTLLAILAGIPVAIALEALTTVAQLVAPLAGASALIAGQAHGATLEKWSALLEEGGRVVICVLAALLVIALARRLAEPPEPGAADRAPPAAHR
ncbi:MAG TPA: hypothetical protein VGM84_00795 [Steroidobacteraceae bacterium]|jgi:hypothetical protein